MAFNSYSEEEKKGDTSYPIDKTIVDLIADLTRIKNRSMPKETSYKTNISIEEVQAMLDFINSSGKEVITLLIEKAPVLNGILVSEKWEGPFEDITNIDRF